MPIRLRRAVALAVIAAALYALGRWLFASGLPVPPPLLPDARETVRGCPLLALRLERVNR